MIIENITAKVKVGKNLRHLLNRIIEERPVEVDDNKNNLTVEFSDIRFVIDKSSVPFLILQLNNQILIKGSKEQNYSEHLINKILGEDDDDIQVNSLCSKFNRYIRLQ
jgi:hypothetical protein